MALLRRRTRGEVGCLLPGTELAFEQDVKCCREWIWARTTSFHVGEFTGRRKSTDTPDHDVIEFPRWKLIMKACCWRASERLCLQL